MVTIDRLKQKKQRQLELFLNEEHQLEIDTALTNLSSRKLWRILELNKLNTCFFDKQFIKGVKNELMLRGDYDEGIAWKEPH